MDAWELASLLYKYACTDTCVRLSDVHAQCQAFSQTEVPVSGVVAMFGSTYNGQFEDVKAFNDKVGEIVFFPCANCCIRPCLRYGVELFGGNQQLNMAYTHNTALEHCA